MGSSENIFKIKIPTPFVNSDGYEYSEQGSKAFFCYRVTRAVAAKSILPLRRSIRNRESRQQLYYTTSVHVGYTLINYMVKYTLVCLNLNRLHTPQTGEFDVIFV